MTSWLRYYAIYAVLVAPFVALDILLVQPRLHRASYGFLFAAIFACMTVAKRLQKRWWP